MEGRRKKLVHSLPPIPVPSSFNCRNGRANKEAATPAGRETQKTTENVATQDPDQEAKRLRRILASRQYSQKYRLKQLHYVLHLEAEVKALQAEIAITTPRIKYADRQNTLLRAENSSMKQKLSAFSGELTYKEAQYEQLKLEKQVLKHLYAVYQHQQQPALVQMGPDQNYYQLGHTDNQSRSDMNPLNQGFHFL